MEDRNGYRKFLEIQVEGLQEHLSALERDPGQVEHLKAMLRTVQRLRHAQEPGEPEPVRILRNAVEKVTLHIGRAGVQLTQEFFDFYVDSFELLEEAVRRWPGGPSFDRARYADRVRALLETTPGSAVAVAEAAAAPPAPAPSPRDRVSEPAMAEEPVTADVADGIVLTEPEAFDSGAGASPATADQAPWSVEAVGRAALADAEVDEYVEADLRDLLAEPWTARHPAPSAAPAGEPSGGLAASYTTYETLRRGRAPAAAREGAGARESLDRLRDVLDTFSVSLIDLDRASDRLLRESLDGSTRTALADRLEAEKEKVLAVFERTIETFRRAEV